MNPIDPTLLGWLRLARADKIASSRLRILIEQFPQGALFAQPEASWLSSLGLTSDEVRQLTDSAETAGLLAEIAQLAARGWTLWHREDDQFPALLRHLGFPPPVVAFTGVTAALSLPMIAIVGSRQATTYGLRIAQQLAAGLAERGYVIVSGLARGIDAAAHRGALQAGGRTVAILGHGLDTVYPPEHAELAQQITRSGALLSEYPPWMPPLAHNFPRRNRLIVGMSYAVVVVEAEVDSGSLVTARLALDENRQLMAIPGRVGDSNSAGTLGLLRAGATLVRSADDVVAELPPDLQIVPSAARSGAGETAAPQRQLDPQAQALLDAIPMNDEVHIDDLLRQLQCSAEGALQSLFELQLAGLIDACPGARFRRSLRT